MRTLNGGAIKPWRSSDYSSWLAKLKQAGSTLHFNVPFCELARAEQDYIWAGDKNFPGVRGFFAELENKKYKLHVRMKVSRNRCYAKCPYGPGARLRNDAVHVLVAGMTVQDDVRRNIAEV